MQDKCQDNFNCEKLRLCFWVNYITSPTPTLTLMLIIKIKFTKKKKRFLFFIRTTSELVFKFLNI